MTTTKWSFGKSVRKLLIKLGLKKPPLPKDRNIFIGVHPDGFQQYPYPKNYVKSSRYTIFTFIPQNLFEQFQRIANFYFLCIAIIQVFVESSVPIALNILPLVFVLLTTMVKQGYEDLLRHKADKEVNDVLVDVVMKSTIDFNNRIHSNEIKQEYAMNLEVGDVIRCTKGQIFPCDMVLLSSSERNSSCYVTTASLDGETNLKVFVAPTNTKHLNSPRMIQENLQVKIVCDHPDEDLYKFNGQLIRMSQKANRNSVAASSNLSSASPSLEPLTSQNILLRGAKLLNTEYVFGAVVYTGQDTKMALNSKQKPAKYSRVELRLNYFLAVFLIILFSLALFCSIMKYVLLASEFRITFYVPQESVAAWPVVRTFFSFVVLFNYLIPISLYVTIELQKFFGSMFFGWDLKMFDEKSGRPAKANTSDLNEELGQVEYLFSDKTGTLTENEMVFKKCSIGGKMYEDIPKKGLVSIDGSSYRSVSFKDSKDVLDFFIILSLCHTVRVEKCSTNEKIKYEASSPDEKAFVEISQSYGVIYTGTNQDNESELTLLCCDNEHVKYKVLKVLDFDSDRKRMSVILQYPDDDSIVLLCKGAEQAMESQAAYYQPLSPTDRGIILDIIREHVVLYAREGLRTLVIGKRVMSVEQYTDLMQQLNTAQASMVNRDALVRKVYDLIESDLVLLGCTGIEDRLQDGVKETIVKLREAGIQIWILTGDKMETALNISRSTGHFGNSKHEIRIIGHTSKRSCYNSLNDNLQRLELDKQSTIDLVIDGQSLTFALEFRDKLFQLCRKSNAVLGCRLTPLQKAMVVQMMKEEKVMDRSKNDFSNPVTAAIGDGSNDVSMILEAHLGIGIYGKEGLQAARSADYAFCCFRSLRRALLGHGHLYYSRLSTLVLYFFYKNTAFIGPQFYFTFFSGFGSQTVYEGLYLILFNITLTSLPIFIYGLVEQLWPIAVLENHAHYYQLIRRNCGLNWFNFFLWNTFGLWHSLTAIFIPASLFYYNDVITVSGKHLGFFAFGTIIMLIVWITTSLKLCLVSRHFTLPVLFGFLITFIGNISLFIAYQSFSSDFTFDLYYVWFSLLQEPFTWFCILIAVIVSITPDIIFTVSFKRCNSIQESTNSTIKTDNNNGLEKSKNVEYDNKGFETEPGQIINQTNQKTEGRRGNEFCYDNPIHTEFYFDKAS